MNFTQFKRVAEDGDKIICVSKGVFGLVIRATTFSSYTHVAGLKWDSEHKHSLRVPEMVETKGFRDLKAESWCISRWKRKQKLYLVRVPKEIKKDPQAIRDWYDEPSNVDASYGYLSLLIVWLVMVDGALGGHVMPWISRQLGIKPERMNAVCSIFQARMDNAMGYETPTIVAPGHFGAYPDGSMHMITPNEGMVSDKLYAKMMKMGSR